MGVILGLDFGTSNTVIWGGTKIDNIQCLFDEPTIIAVNHNESVIELKDFYRYLRSPSKSGDTYPNAAAIKRSGGKLFLCGKEAARDVSGRYRKQMALKAYMTQEKLLSTNGIGDESDPELANVCTLLYLTFAIKSAVLNMSTVYKNEPVDKIFFTHPVSQVILPAIRDIIKRIYGNIDAIFQTFAPEFGTVSASDSVRQVFDLDKVEFIPESAAAAFSINYDINKKANIELDDNQGILVIDCGGGTVDYSHFKFNKTEPNIYTGTVTDEDNIFQSPQSTMMNGHIGNIDGKSGVAGVKFDMYTLAYAKGKKDIKVFFDARSKDEMWDIFNSYISQKSASGKEGGIVSYKAVRVPITEKNLKDAKSTVLMSAKSNLLGSDQCLFEMTKKIYSQIGDSECKVCCIGGFSKSSTCIEVIREALRQCGFADSNMIDPYIKHRTQLDQIVARGALLRGLYSREFCFTDKVLKLSAVINGEQKTLTLVNGSEDYERRIYKEDGVRWRKMTFMLMRRVPSTLTVSVLIDGEEADITKCIYTVDPADSGNRLLRFKGKGQKFEECTVSAYSLDGKLGIVVMCGAEKLEIPLTDAIRKG